MRKNMNNLRPPFAIALAVFASIASAATKSEWTFHHEAGALATNRYVLQVLKSNDSKAQLWTNDDGSFEFRLLGAGADECWSRTKPAAVERTAETTTITPEGLYATCPKIRLVIRNDGSGGQVQQLQGPKRAPQWVTDDERDYDLKPR